MPIFVIFYILFTQYYTSNNTQTPTFASKYKSIIMSTFQNTAGRMTNYRWIICAMLFFATTVNYLDRQVLSLTWKDFISPEFHWLPDVSSTGWERKKGIYGPLPYGLSVLVCTPSADLPQK